MSEILPIVQQWFEGEDWGTELGPEGDVLRAGFVGKNGEIPLFVKARQDAQQVIVYSRTPFNTPEEKRPAMAELITRANYGMLLGNFEMDYSDGEVRFKTSIDVEGAELQPQLLRHLVYPNVLMMDRYLPAIVSVVYGGAAPAEAIARVEG